MEITTHRLGYGGSYVPAVNVKVYASINDIELPAKDDDFAHRRFTHEWIRENLPERKFLEEWDWACRRGWDMLEEIAHEIYGNVSVYAEGRNGGWAYIQGSGFNPDYTEWTEEEQKQWEKFCERAKAVVEDIPYQAVWGIWANHFNPMIEAEEEFGKQFATKLQARIDQQIGCEL